MIEITKQEADYMRDHIKDVVIATTSKHKNKRQKKRFIEESARVKKMLSYLRSEKSRCA